MKEQDGTKPKNGAVDPMGINSADRKPNPFRSLSDPACADEVEVKELEKKRKK